MAEELRFDGKVVIVTGAGNGLGRSHALLFARRGARVVVNDLGGGHTGGGKSSAAADAVVDEIKAAGGEAVANYDSVEDGAKIVQSALDAFGRVDVVINNAGILRDVSFQKMSADDWDLIYRVHVLGAYRVTAAAWPHLREQKYGRVIFTASAAGIYGNFGQANYSMAKLGVVGFANTLALEGKKNNVLVNTIAPIAGSRMTETVLPKDLLDALKPEYVSPLVAWLSHESQTDTGGLYEVGGGFMAKLRWERAEGVTFRLGRAVTPEAIRERWSDVTGFDKTTHPATVTESMAPIMTNVEAGPSKGGNQFIDVDRALGHEYPPTTAAYSERDVALYALGVGAGSDPTDPKDLALTYEMNGEGFFPLPTMTAAIAVQQVMKLAMDGKQAPGLDYGLDRILHGEQYTEVLRPLPPHQKLTNKGKVKAIYDKGKGAVVVIEMRSLDEDGELLAVNEVSTFVRGAGGWGGDRGPAGESNTPPERAPDAVVEEKTRADQALLYRLSGDINPLHADPSFASNFGFPKPILHGLCTYGYAARHVIKSFSGGDPRLFKSIRVRFADSVFPGETIITEMWKEGGKILLRCKVKERDKVVISNAAVELYDAVPEKKAKAKSAGGGAASVSAEPIAADVFAGIGSFLKKNPDLAAKVGKVFQFRLTNPSSVWTIDLKSNAVGSGETAPSECTLELSDADFMAMCTGKANPMKLFTSGKLKISGNVMASQKLDFLTKLDKKEVEAAMGASSTASASAPAELAAPKITSGVVFTAIGAWLGKNPDIAAKVGTVYQFRLTDPASVWTLDLKLNKVTQGEAARPECTLELSDADFMAMTEGKANPMKLFTSGKLKISGNVMASQKLDFLTKLDKKEVEAAMGASPRVERERTRCEARRAASSGSSASAPGVFAALGERLAKHPQLAAELAARVQFTITDPDARMDRRREGHPPTVSEGRSSNVDAVITLTDADLASLASGAQSARWLYQQGRLKVDGDVRVAHRLGVLKANG
ncbi:MAG: SDR family NAD(P)-dependent oxidoreductase [Polyangiales bacterium]